MTAAPSRRPAARLFAALLLSASLAGCASLSNQAADSDEAFDPIEGVNRAVFGLNEGADILILHPVSEIYKGVVPDPIRTAISNFLHNLREPLNLINSLLQGDTDQAAVSGKRFLVNTTAGIGGLIDVAADHGLAYRGEDFGQTLGVWGVGNGPYVVLPLLGPSTLRDTAGIAVDTAGDPVRLTVENSLDFEDYSAASGAARGIDARARVGGAIEDLRRNSVDYYATVRSLYLQRRNADIANESGTGPDIPDFDEPAWSTIDNGSGPAKSN